MKFGEFLKIYNQVPLIDSSTFSLYSDNTRNLRRQVREWIIKGYVLPLKKGVYIFNDNYRKREPPCLFIANFLISPSYLSLEYAFGFYDLIPEKVTVFTSITTKKTKSLKNCLGVFEYRSIKEDLFFGVKEEVDKDREFFIALPEKALLDYFYFNHQFRGRFSEFESLRLQNLEIIDKKRLSAYSLGYNKRIKEIARNLICYINQYEEKYRVL